MTIRKKLYLNFTFILGIVVVLCLINIVTVNRESSARDATQKAFDVKQGSESIRFQMMQNRQLLSNYLLSGSTGEANQLTEGMAKLQQSISKTVEKAQDEQQKTALARLAETERDWENNFARLL